MIRKLLLAPLVLLAPAAASDGAVPVSADTLLAALPHCSDDTLPAGPEIMPGYGGGGFVTDSTNPDAQAFFDNGMQLAHGFAHKAASAAFAEAARLDPACAMCAWGMAWAAGPTINYGINPAQQAVALKEAQKAALLITPATSTKQRALIAALNLRYASGGGQGAGDHAFAKAMDDLADQYPEDDEIAVIAADAQAIPVANAANQGSMATPHLERAEALLEHVLARRPDYTPAIHFYIHVTEMMGHPGRAERYADKLPRLAPASSHLTHMPSHTYYWIGRYQDAVDANVKAVAMGIENGRHAGLPQPDGEWQLPYHAHNVQYGVGAALISGDAADALALSDPALANAAAFGRFGAFGETALGTAYFAEGRYADPATVRALAQPAAGLRFARAYWHYARGEAAARAGEAAAVRAEAAAIPNRFADVKIADASQHAAQLALVAREVLTGRAAMIDRDYADAARSFERAARLSSARFMAVLSDPPGWWYPVRRSLAAALLAKGDARGGLHQAELALAERPGDPVSLRVKAECEAQLGEANAAANDRAAAAKAWHGTAAALADAAA